MSIKPSSAVIVAVLAVLIGYGLYVSLRNSTLNNNFNSVGKGASREEIILLMGKPDSQSESCLDDVTWLEQPVIGEKCASEIRYNANLLPKYWTIGFDEHGRAIAKYQYVSP